jgi:hypothetical protein
MRPFKFLATTLKLSCFTIILSGCVAGFTAPVTALPLLVISVVLLIPQPTLYPGWYSWWQGLTTALLVQASLFSAFALTGAATELEKVGQGLNVQAGWLTAIQAAQAKPFLWNKLKTRFRNLMALGLLALLPPLFLGSLLYLWRQGHQTWAIVLLFPFLLILVSLLVLMVGSSVYRKPPSKRTVSPHTSRFRKRQKSPFIKTTKDTKEVKK